MAFKVDPEFKALIPPLTTDERAGLEESIAKEGVRDPLVVWTEQDVLLDGHNRYEIASKLGRPYNTVGMSFADEDAAKVWIIRNQFSRRNLSPYQRAELALTLDAVLKPKAKERQGERIDIHQKSGGCRGEGPVDREIAKAAGVSHDTIHKARVIAEKATEPVKEKLRSGGTTINAAYTEIRRVEKEEKREAKRAKNAVLVAEAPSIEAVSGVFSTIVIDPPWDWGDEGDCDQLGRARPTYQTLPMADLLALPVARLADDDCHLYLWITNRSLPKGFALLDAWGFRYVTCLTWCKPSFGMGNYFRGQSEHVLFGVRGSMAIKRKDVGTVLNAKRGPDGHSSKPEEFYAMVESCSHAPYVEMFARRQRPGWQIWGAEV